MSGHRIPLRKNLPETTDPKRIAEKLATYGVISRKEAEERIERIRRIPAKAFSDSLSVQFGVNLTVDEAFNLIKGIKRFSNYQKRRKLLKDELRISWEEAKRAYELYKAAKCEAIREAIIFLAGASPSGPRGRKAELVSVPNVGRCLNLSLNTTLLRKCYREIGEGKWRGMRGFILSLMLTASNPEEAGVDFSLEDLKRGVYIPEREEEAYAVGLAYSYAYMPQYPSNSVLVFEGRKRDRAFFKHISTVMEEIYNIRSEERVINRPPSTQVLGGKVKRFSQYEQPTIIYCSKALCEHLVKDHGFPTCLKEIRESRIPEHYMSSKKFLKGLLTKVVVVNPLGERPHLVYIRKSRKFLEDLQILMENCGVELSSSIRRRGRSFGMYVGVDSTEQLFEEEFIDRPKFLEEYTGN